MPVSMTSMVVDPAGDVTQRERDPLAEPGPDHAGNLPFPVVVDANSEHP